MIFDLTLLLLLQLVGEATAFATGLPIPGPVIGLVLLVVLLNLRRRPLGSLEQTCTGLLRHLSLLFVPAGVGVMLHGARLAAEWPAILLAILVSTCASMAVTAAVMSWASARWAGGAR
ncbi:MAG: CidA/LrgA family protein [Geminicoccaceae bacterium]|mgnify:CR=1 FL=1